jgi:nitrogen fixation/metabolism regulation signal transduction histidine kinase
MRVYIYILEAVLREEERNNVILQSHLALVLSSPLAERIIKKRKGKTMGNNSAATAGELDSQLRSYRNCARVRRSERANPKYLPLARTEVYS